MHLTLVLAAKKLPISFSVIKIKREMTVKNSMLGKYDSFSNIVTHFLKEKYDEI